MATKKREFRLALGRALARIGDPSYRASSWCRTPEHNRKVGGVANSQHLTCTAVDVVGFDQRLIGAARAEGLQVLTNYPNHIHIQRRK